MKVKGRLSRRVAVVAIFCGSLIAFDRLLAATIVRATVSRARQAELRLKLLEARERGPYDVLVLGTSRAFEAIHPADIAERTGARVYKEAFQGKGPRYHYEFYQRFRRTIGRPRVVVYAVDYFLFSVRSEPARLAAFGIQADPWEGWRRPSLLLVEQKRANDLAIVRALEAWQRSASGHREADPERYQRDMEAYRGSNLPRDGDPPEPAPSGFGKVTFPRYPGEEGAYLARLLDDLEAGGVEVLLVGLPDFIATYRTNFDHEAFDGNFQRLAARHRHCVFVNYCSPERFPLSEPDYFSDGRYGNMNSHLSGKGVKPFLELLLPDLRKALARAGMAEP